MELMLHVIINFYIEISLVTQPMSGPSISPPAAKQLRQLLITHNFLNSTFKTASFQVLNSDEQGTITPRSKFSTMGAYTATSVYVDTLKTVGSLS